MLQNRHDHLLTALEYKNFVFIKVTKAISSQTRLNILKILIKEKIVLEQELIERMGMTKQNISFHVNILKSAHFVDIRKKGKNIAIILNKNNDLELNYSLINLLQRWFSKKEGERF